MSNYPEQVYDPIRRRLVAAIPEEMVRQKLLRKMLGDLGFPKGLIAVEAHLGESKRRADIVCYVPMPHLRPLLVVECKASVLSLVAEEQAFGYNSVLGAPFICLAGGEEIATLWLDGGKIARIPFLPPYRELYDAAKTIFS